MAQPRWYAKLSEYRDHHYGARHSVQRHLIVSDNGPQFMSKQFEDWCRLNGIVHLTSASFQPPSNREADRLIGVFKIVMRRSVVERQGYHGLSSQLPSTPNCATGCTPAELMIGRQVRTLLPLLQPSVHHAAALHCVRDRGQHFRSELRW